MYNFCQVIDDSLFESPEEFELRLSDSSYNAKIGTLSSATVIIDGPNDGKLIFFLNYSDKLMPALRIKLKHLWIFEIYQNIFFLESSIHWNK